MLAKMLQSLKPDGRVALVEYRVEDGTGDHIKGDHRMSVRQVLSEWVPAGFDLVELHEFLPSQHLFFFQPRSDNTVGQVIAQYDILEAIEEGHIEVSASDLGPETVNFTLRRTRPEPMVITLPVGTYFETAEETSDLIATKDGVVVLLDEDTKNWTVRARTVQGDLPNAGPQDPFRTLSPRPRTMMTPCGNGFT